MAVAALRGASRCLASRGSAAAARPMLLAHSRGITYKLFIGGLSQFATEDSLAEAFSRYGQVLNGRVIYVDIAKAKMDRDADARPIARGPPKPIGND
ncbi:hypothetical protein BAE44_0004221 [Dichanthelium oligosanthes]|uniref:RRM domain-containing protein n=1 Tax=Dichanthelium oligosanthes TaxID=888268 RepID=A0A1E5WBM2_9POAL|nr:hypothetical protein BAE44_0004221 [Dichanthelium oligosanthes]